VHVEETNVRDAGLEMPDRLAAIARLATTSSSGQTRASWRVNASRSSGSSSANQCGRPRPSFERSESGKFELGADAVRLLLGQAQLRFVAEDEP
jgi:hypothetical protein